MTKFLVSALLASALSVSAFAKEYNIDKSHSSVGFSVSHLTVSKVEGTFPEFSGRVDIDPKTKQIVALEGEIDISKLNTRNSSRDSHLQTEEFFDATNFPKGILKATKISKDKDGVMIEADLTLKGITQKVMLKGTLKGPVQHPSTRKEVWGLDLSGMVMRMDFKLSEQTSSAVIGNEISIDINLEVHEQ